MADLKFAETRHKFEHGGITPTALPSSAAARADDIASQRLPLVPRAANVHTHLFVSANARTMVASTPVRPLPLLVS